MALTKRIRFEILRRDGHTCRYCGASAPDVKLTVDHVIPVSLGGSDEPSNLVAACADCNTGKGSTSPDEQVVADVDEKAVKYAAAIAKVSERRRARKEVEDGICSAFIDAWFQVVGRNCRPANDWRGSFLRMVSLGLDSYDFEELMYATAASQAWKDDKWRYFCGCCWRRIREKQQEAIELIESGEI